MTDWQTLVVVERRELNAKIGALRVFIYGPSFVGLDSTDKALLKDQYNTMVKYSNLLSERIERFK